MHSFASRLTRIIYTSRRAAGTMHLEEAALVEQILGVSRPKNACWRLSGLLVSGNGRFAQTLEGPPDLVAAMFDIIRQDERHHDVTLLHQAPAPARCFATWTMAYLSDAEFMPEELGAAEGATGLVTGLRAAVRGGPAAFAATPFAAVAKAASRAA